MTRPSYEPACTVISLVPFPIEETKPGMVPSKFVIPACPEDKFATLLVKKCTHGVYLDSDRPVLVVPTVPEEVAQSICFDYMKGQMALTLGDAEPGLFWIWGDHHMPLEEWDEKRAAAIIAEHAAEFRAARTKQHNWFKALVALADDAWSKFHQRGMISVPQRIAAARLKLEREWLLEAEVTASMSECPVCFDKVHPRAILCRTCNAILKPEEYARHQFANKQAATPPPVPVQTNSTPATT